MTDLVRVDLTGPAQTMLSTLYCKALDAGFERPILGDTFARQAVDRIDFDWSSLKIAETWAPLVTVRTAQYDIWAAQFLAAHPRATVIHLGCGLDSRVFRLDPAGIDQDDLELYLIDHGLDEMGEGSGEKDEPQLVIRCNFPDFGQLQKGLEDRHLVPLSAEQEYICTTPTELPEDQAREVLEFIDKLEQDEDVQKVFHTLV